MRKLPDLMRAYLRFSPFAGLLGALWLTACSVPTMVAESVHPYRIDVRQGNYVDQAMVSQLRKGMSEEQVRFILGTPLLVDIFHTSRWDYVYRFKPGSGTVEERRLSVFFRDGKLDYLDGDVIGGDAPASVATGPTTRVIDLGTAEPLPESAKDAPEKKSWWRFW